MWYIVVISIIIIIAVSLIHVSETFIDASDSSIELSLNDVSLWFSSQGDALKAQNSLNGMQPFFRGCDSISMTSDSNGYLLTPTGVTNPSFLKLAQGQFTSALTYTELLAIKSSPCFGKSSETCNACGSTNSCGWCPGKNVCVPKSSSGLDKNKICNEYTFLRANNKCGPYLPVEVEDNSGSAFSFLSDGMPQDEIEGTYVKKRWATSDWVKMFDNKDDTYSSKSIMSGCPRSDTVQDVLKHFQSCGY